MANIRQYVGARYVTKIYENSLDSSSAEWESNVTYEPLTLVTYNNSSYLSKKDVPASVGNPAQNPTYWVVTGAYNGQIATLQAQIDAINNNDIPAITALIQTLNDSIAPTENGTNYSQSYTMGDEFYRNGVLYKVTATSVGTSDAINTGVGGNATAADDITSQIKTLHNKTNVIIFGDSWTDSAHDSDIRVDVMIEKQFGVTVHNYSYGGTGFDVTNGYDDQITWFAADNIDPNTIKFILLSAGGNEYYTDNVSAGDFVAKLEDWYTKLKAVVGIDIPIYWSISYSIDDDYTLTYPTNYFNQFNYYTAIIESLNAPITQIQTFGMIKSWKNNTHPDLAGHITLGQGIINSIKGVPPLLYPYEEITGEVQDPDFSGGFRNVVFTCYSNGPELDCELKFAMGTLGTIPSGTQILFPKSLPAYVTNNMYLGEGCVIANRAANSFEVNVQNASARTWTRSMSGNKAIKFTLT